MYVLLQSTGGMGACAPYGYSSDSGAARICHREAKARERSDRVGEGVPPPTVGRFSKIRVA